MQFQKHKRNRPQKLLINKCMGNILGLYYFSVHITYLTNYTIFTNHLPVLPLNFLPNILAKTLLQQNGVPPHFVAAITLSVLRNIHIYKKE